MDKKLCSKHGKPRVFVCKNSKCPDTFVCEERECQLSHFHSKELISLYFVQKMIESSQNLEKVVVAEITQKIQEYYQKASQQISSCISQHKQMTLLLLDKLRSEISMGEDDKALLEKLKGQHIYDASKEQIMRGWGLLKQASLEVTKGKDVGYLIRQIEKSITKFQANLQNLKKKELRKMFDFTGAVFHDLNEVQLQKEEYEVLNDLLTSKNICINRSKLVFDAKEHNFSASKFHQICNGLDNTIILVRSENKRLFGAYVGKKWSSNGNWESDDKAFLFSVDNKCICSQFSNQTYALYTLSNYGPTFGGNHDLYLADNCGSNTQSYSQMGYTYKPDDAAVDQSYGLAGQRNFKVQNYIVLQLNQ